MKRTFALLPVVALVFAGLALFSCEKDKNTTNNNNTNVPVIHDEGVEGALSGLFTVSANRQVYFSKGNLQYTTDGTHAVADGGTRQGTWRFAENQWDTIGAENRNISPTYNGWIDLFGWGTSGYHNPDDQYNTNYNPYDTSSAIVNTSYNNYGYGPSTNMADINLTGTSANYDWGTYNAISNGGNQPGMWRTLTQTEWDTLFNHRKTSSGIRYALGTVNGVPGLIIVPDNWKASTYALKSTNNPNTSMNANVINASQWTALEKAGCAFLPAAGCSGRLSVRQVGVVGYYWSASGRGGIGIYAYGMSFAEFNFSLKWQEGRFGRLSVRLVRDAK